MIVDRTNTKCDCGGTFGERSLNDDLDGQLTCDNCMLRIARYGDDDMSEKLETQVEAINQVALLADMICLPGDGLSGDQIREFAKRLQEFNGCYDVALAQMSFDYSF